MYNAKRTLKSKTHPLVKEGITQGLLSKGFSYKKETLVLSLKMLDTKKKLLAENLRP
jgi:hypothetical protein